MTTCGTIVTEYGDTCILGAGHGGHCRIGEGIGRADLVEMLAHAHAAQRPARAAGRGDATMSRRAAPRLPIGQRVTIRYKCRDIGYGVERGMGVAYLTAEVDAWGKRTILVERGTCYEPIYLFPDEFSIARQVRAEGARP